MKMQYDLEADLILCNGGSYTHMILDLRKNTTRRLYCERTGIPGLWTVVGACVITLKTIRVQIDPAGLLSFMEGVKIQDALPTASADTREFILSGISPEGWRQTMEGEEEEEE